VDDFDAYTTNKHAGNPVPMDTEKRDLYLRLAELEAQLKHCEGRAAEFEAQNKTLRNAYWAERKGK
jgi:hypothetical protein